MAQQYYHIGKNGPFPCKAKMGRCPYSGKGVQDHWDNIEDATNAFAAQMAPKYGTTATLLAKDLKKSPKYKFYKSLDDNPKLMTTYKVLKATAKVSAFVIGTTAAATIATMRLTSSLISNKKLGGSRKINAKKLLLTKYWMPDIHSNKWR